MRLDEKLREAIARVIDPEEFGLPAVLPEGEDYLTERDEARFHAERAIEVYLSFTVPGDVQKLIKRLNKRYRAYMSQEPGPQLSASVVDGLEAAATTFFLSVEITKLKARLDGTVGVEILEK